MTCSTQVFFTRILTAGLFLNALVWLPPANADSSWWTDSEPTHKHTNAEGQDLGTTATEHPSPPTFQSKKYTPSTVKIDKTKLAIDATDAGLSEGSKNATKIFKSKHHAELFTKGTSILGPGLKIVDSFTKPIGRLSAGDGTGAIAELVGSGGEWAAATSGAAAGAATGASIGAAFGGPAAPITGTIGAIAGAAFGSYFYQSTVRDTILQSSEKMLDGAFAPTPLTLDQRLAEVAKQKRLIKERNTTYLRKPTGIKDTRTFLRAPGSKYDPLAPDKTVWNANKKATTPKKKPHKTSKKEAYAKLKKKATSMEAENKLVSTINFDSIPVIPLNCTIDFRGWPQEHPEHKFEFSLDIRDGKINDSFSITTPGNQNSSKSSSSRCSPWVHTYHVTGIIKNNILHTESFNDGIPAQHCQTSGTLSKRVGDDYVEVPYTCITRYAIPTKSSSVTTLNLDATYTDVVTSTTTPTYTVDGTNCNQDAEHVLETWREHGVYNTTTQTIVGVWSIRK